MVIFQCAMCPEVFDQKVLRRTHEISEHTSPYKCYYCPKIFEKRQNFVKHVQIHNKEKRFYCDICNKNLSRRDNLIRHYTTVHEKEYAKRPRKPTGPNVEFQRFVGQFISQFHASLSPVMIPMVQVKPRIEVFDFKSLAESHEFPSISEHSNSSSSNSFSTRSSSSTPSLSHSPVPPADSFTLLNYIANANKNQYF